MVLIVMMPEKEEEEEDRREKKEKIPATLSASSSFLGCPDPFSNVPN